jgi:D-alanyl-D-alanine endopeptidase (penicillin-binding protein 7)
MRTLIIIALLLGAVSAIAKNKRTEVGPTQRITAKSWLVADVDGNIIEGVNTREVRSVASITKLMTTMVVLDSGAPLDERVGVLYGRHMTRQQLIDLAMIHSDNTAARILCETYPAGYSGCVRAMNAKAVELGMSDTQFTEPTGLYDTNVSTAVDLVKLVRHAAGYSEIVRASNQATVSLEPVVTKKTKKPVATVFPNTNSIVRTGAEFIVSKTGFIRRAGGCIVFTVLAPNGWRTVVLLGSANTKTRIPEAKMLMERY